MNAPGLLYIMIGTSALATGMEHWSCRHFGIRGGGLRARLGYTAGLLRPGSTWINAYYAHSLSELSLRLAPPASVYIMLQQQLMLRKYTTPVPWI